MPHEKTHICESLSRPVEVDVGSTHLTLHTLLEAAAFLENSYSDLSRDGLVLSALMSISDAAKSGDEVDISDATDDVEAVIRLHK